MCEATYHLLWVYERSDGECKLANLHMREKTILENMFGEFKNLQRKELVFHVCVFEHKIAKIGSFPIFELHHQVLSNVAQKVLVDAVV